MNKKYTFIAILMLLFLASCNDVTNTEQTEEVVQTIENQNSLEKEEIKLSENGISYNGSNAKVDGNIITIKKYGNYEITGTLKNGQIVVDSEDELPVQLILKDVNITNETSAAIYVKNAKQTTITLKNENYLSDGTKYEFENKDDDEPNATIFSKDDLIIQAEDNASLTIKANYQDAIVSKDKLYIKSGKFDIEAEDDGIRGKDYLQIDDGNITIKAGADALKASDEQDGKMVINGGNINIEADDDAVHAEIELTINNGDINITKSYEGLEAQQITINDGNINIVSSDDGINAAGGSTTEGNTKQENNQMNDEMMTIMDKQRNGETLTEEEQKQLDEFEQNRPARPDHNHFDNEMMTIMHKQRNGETLTEEEQKQLDEFEQNRPQMIDGGNMPLMGENTENSNYNLFINGGIIKINASGDGLDANGYIKMTGGQVYVNGPTSNGNGPLDYDRGFTITGGILIAAGSSGMAQNIGTDSTQYGVLFAFENSEKKGTKFTLQDENNDEIMSFTPEKDYQSVVFSSSALQKGKTYTYYINDEKKETFTIENITTTVGTIQKRMGGK